MNTVKFLRLGSLVFFMQALVYICWSEETNKIVYTIYSFSVIWFAMFAGGLAYILEAIEKK